MPRQKSLVHRNSNSHHQSHHELKMNPEAETRTIRLTSEIIRCATDQTNSHNMANHNTSNTTMPVHEELSPKTDVLTIYDPIFEAPWPWLERFGVLIHRSCDPSCSLWLATCTFLPLSLSCSPRHKKVWVDLKANEQGNRIRRFFGLPEIWIEEPESSGTQ
jgi:hypothetical protein